MFHVERRATDRRLPNGTRPPSSPRFSTEPPPIPSCPANTPLKPRNPPQRPQGVARVPVDRRLRDPRQGCPQSANSRGRNPFMLPRSGAAGRVLRGVKAGTSRREVRGRAELSTPQPPRETRKRQRLDPARSLCPSLRRSTQSEPVTVEVPRGTLPIKADAIWGRPGPQQASLVGAREASGHLLPWPPRTNRSTWNTAVAKVAHGGFAWPARGRLVWPGAAQLNRGGGQSPTDF